MSSCFRSPVIALVALGAVLPMAAAAQTAPATGTVVGRCAEAASAWIATLDADQRRLGVWPFEEARRREWHYLNNLPPIYVRHEGLAFKRMTADQRILAHELMRCALSSQGYQKSTAVMLMESLGWSRLPDQGIAVAKKLSDTVGTMDSYWLAIFGDPANGTPWQWQVEGHHLALNITFVGERIAVTPTFLGSRPNVIGEGEFAGWHALGYEKTRALELMSALRPGQRRRAVLGEVVANNIFTAPERLDALSRYEGLPAREMSTHQRELLWRIIDEYVLNYEPDIAAERRAEIRRDGIGNVHFAWLGPTDDPEKPVYFRVHGPSVLIEFANASNLGGAGAPRQNADGSLQRGAHDVADPNHIHSVYLNPRSNFGEDLLRQHYLEFHTAGVGD